MEIDANVLLAIIGQKEVELSYLRERVTYLENQAKEEQIKKHTPYKNDKDHPVALEDELPEE